MIIKKYLANTLKDAEELMRQELGPTATVLTSRTVKQKGLRRLFLPDKTELTAAVEAQDLELFNLEKKHSLQKEARKSRSSQTAREESFSSQKQSGQQQFSQQQEDRLTLSAKAKKKQEKLESLKQEERLGLKGLAMEESLNRSNSATCGSYAFSGRLNAPQMPISQASHDLESTKRESNPFSQVSRNLISHFAHDLKEEIEELNLEKSKKVETAQPIEKAPTLPKNELSEVDRLRQLVKDEVQRAQESVSVGSLQQNEENLVGSVRFLISKGIDRQIALQIEKLLDQNYPQVNLAEPSHERSSRLNLLKLELANKIKTGGGIFLTRASPAFVAIVGPTGVGKTTTLVKLAAQHSKLGKKVGIISLDNTKIGAREQIFQWATSLSLPCKAATTIDEMKEAIASLYHLDLVLIDTGGKNQYNWQQVDELNSLIQLVNQPQILLAISATTKDVDAYGILRQFSPLLPQSVIVTKTDETIALGLLVNISQKFGYPISYLSCGPRLEDLKVAQASEIAHNLLVLQNSAEYQQIRHLASA